MELVNNDSGSLLVETSHRNITRISKTLVCIIAFLTIQKRIRTRITTNSNFPQRPNESIIQNSKNSKLVKSSKYKNHDQTWTKNHYSKQTIMRKQKRRNEKRWQPSKTPCFFFFLLSSFVFISHNHLHKKKYLRRFDALRAPSLKLEIRFR